MMMRAARHTIRLFLWVFSGRLRVARLLMMLACLLVARVSSADVKAVAESTKVGLGDRTRIHLVATSSGDVPTDPQLASNSLIFEASAPNAFPSQSVSIVNGSMTVSTSLNADWTLLAKKMGTATFTLRARINGKLVSSNPVTITVVAAGTAPAPPTRRDPFGGMFGGQSPFGAQGFDPFSMMQNGGVDSLPTMPLTPSVPLEQKLALNAPRGQIAFLHAIVDKSAGVVGEQITFSVYLYVDPDQREPDFNDVHESSAVDFTKTNLIDDSKDSQPVQYASVAGKIWGAKLIRKWALFPLKTGLLEIGSMRLAVVGGRGGTAVRGSESIVVKIDDPPIAGRPPGYVSGNVGVYSLVANVSPRDVEHGGAVGVDVMLAGTGNLPSTITPPPQQGVEWLDPEIRDDMSTKTGVVGGSRSFSYIAHVNRGGAIDLGEISVPYFDPDKHVYGTARAVLGVVNVKGSSKADPAEAHDDDPLPGLPAPQATLARDAPKKHLADRSVFWLALFFSPFAFVVVATGRGASRRLRGALEFRRASPESLLGKRIADAKAASKLTDSRALDAAVTKMIEQGAIVRAGVNVRALTIDETEDHLAVRGVTRATAHEIADLLRACEEARFLPEAGDIETSRDRLARALEAIENLGKRKEKSSRE